MYRIIDNFRFNYIFISLLNLTKHHTFVISLYIKTIHHQYQHYHHSNFNQQISNIDKDSSIMNNPNYEILNNSGKRIRYVKPYFQEFKTHSKGRWIGRYSFNHIYYDYDSIYKYYFDFKLIKNREILEVFIREFGAHPKEYWIDAIANGQVKINSHIVTSSYRFKSNDILLHRTHRHEPPVFGEIRYVDDTKELLAISKPPSLPMHPCGAYRYNSLEYIMKYEQLITNQPNLYIVHRLDRVTSGLVVLAKSKHIAALISEQIRDKATIKIYLARVKGKFPNTCKDLNHFKQLSMINLNEFNNESDDYNNNIDIETTNNHKENKNQSNNNNNNNKTKKRKQIHTNQSHGNGLGINADELPPLINKNTITIDEVVSSDNVGILFSKKKSIYIDDLDKTIHSNNNNDFNIVANTITTNDNNKIESDDEIIYSFNNTNTTTTSNNNNNNNNNNNDTNYTNNDTDNNSSELWVKCPIGVVSHREGVYACDPTGKPCLSVFRNLGYDELTDTSLIACRPYTGRTHQLRLHLQLIGNPIANDPCYGGELFYSNTIAKNQAIDAVQLMYSKGMIPLSKIPHFGDSNIDDILMKFKNGNSLNTTNSNNSITNNISSNTNKQSDVHIMDSNKQSLIKNKPYDNETDDDYLIRTCRYCRDNSSLELEHLLHCDGIWLHALKYTGPPIEVTTNIINNSINTIINRSNTTTNNNIAISNDFSSSSNNSTGFQCNEKMSLQQQKIDSNRNSWSFQANYPDWAIPFKVFP